MSLTEDEVKALADDVGEVDLLDPIVIEWVKSNLETLEVEEKRLKAAFKFHRLMRNDVGMTAASIDLERIRKSHKAMVGMLATTQQGAD